MTENTEATTADPIDPRRQDWERRRARSLPTSGGTYKRNPDGSLPTDKDGNHIPEADSVTSPPTGKSELRRALFARDMCEEAGHTHDNERARALFEAAHSAATVPAPRSRRGSTPPADDNNTGAAGSEA